MHKECGDCPDCKSNKREKKMKLSEMERLYEVNKLTIRNAIEALSEFSLVHYPMIVQEEEGGNYSLPEGFTDIRIKEIGIPRYSLRCRGRLAILHELYHASDMHRGIINSSECFTEYRSKKQLEELFGFVQDWTTYPESEAPRNTGFGLQTIIETLELFDLHQSKILGHGVGEMNPKAFYLDTNSRKMYIAECMGERDKCQVLIKAFAQIGRILETGSVPTTAKEITHINQVSLKTLREHFPDYGY